MIKKLLLLSLLAACGGSSKPAETPPPPADPAPANEAAAEPAPPPEPAEPAAPPAPDPAVVKAELLAAETAAFEKAKPVFTKHCARCHTKGGKQSTKKKRDHFDTTTYPFGGEHAGEIAEEVRETLGIGGGKPTMPMDKKGAVKGEELALIAAWADAWEAAHKGGAHEGHAEGHKH